MEEVRIPITPAMRKLLDAQHRTQIQFGGKPLSDKAQVMLYMIVGVSEASEYEGMAASELDGMDEAIGRDYLALIADEVPSLSEKYRKH